MRAPTVRLGSPDFGDQALCEQIGRKSAHQAQAETDALCDLATSQLACLTDELKNSQPTAIGRERHPLESSFFLGSPALLPCKDTMKYGFLQCIGPLQNEVYI